MDARMFFVKKKFILLGILLILFLVIPPIYYFYNQYQKMSSDYQKTKLLLNKSADIKKGADTQSIIEKLSKLIELPNEEPTIATVSDKTKLQGQPFFANVQNGDAVVVYTTAKKAILYRESANKIIEVGL